MKIVPCFLEYFDNRIIGKKLYISLSVMCKIN